MKKCKFCDSLLEIDAKICSACGANEFKFICENCGNEFDVGLHCPKCGIKIGQKEKVCPVCGNHYFTNACSNCGYSELKSTLSQLTYSTVMPHSQTNTYASTNTYTSNEDKNAQTEFWLCLFLGLYGVHKFYRGKIGLGILYMFTGGLFLIGWLVDIFTLAYRLWQK